MTDSLIPYTFVPGTKAKASEVNANFVAVAEAINSSNGAISDLSTEMSTALESRLDLTMSNSHNMTNCVTAAPNGVASYSGLTITAKAGLKVLMPNGRNSDGTFKNTVYTLENAVSATDTVSSGKRIFTLTSTGTLLFLYKECFLYGDNSSKPGTLSDTNTYVYFAKDENKMYTTSGSTAADWTQINLCTLGSYNVTSSTISNFDYKNHLDFTDVANRDLSNLSDAGEIHYLRPSNSCMKVATSGVIATCSGRAFSKSYDDECICAVVRSADNGYTSVVMVGPTERSVTGYDAYDTTPRYSGTINWHGQKYYYFYSLNMVQLSGGLIKGSIPVLTTSIDWPQAVLETYYKTIDCSMPLHSYTEGGNGYRVWADGWIEQWGRITNSSGSWYITFPRAFSNTHYSFSSSQFTKSTPETSDTDSGGISNSIAFYAATTTTINYSYVNGRSFTWYACGY